MRPVCFSIYPMAMVFRLHDFNFEICSKVLMAQCVVAKINILENSQPLLTFLQERNRLEVPVGQRLYKLSAQEMPLY